MVTRMDLNHRYRVMSPTDIRLPTRYANPWLTYFLNHRWQKLSTNTEIIPKKDFIGIVLSTNAAHQPACEALQDSL